MKPFLIPVGIILGIISFFSFSSSSGADNSYALLMRGVVLAVVAIALIFFGFFRERKEAIPLLGLKYLGFALQAIVIIWFFKVAYGYFLKADLSGFVSIPLLFILVIFAGIPGHVMYKRASRKLKEL